MRLLTQMFRQPLLALVFTLIALPAAFAEESLKQFAIESKPLAEALMEFGTQADIVVVVPTSLTAGKTAPSVAGTFQPAAALAALLEGSGLVAYPVNKKTYGIRLLAPEASVQGVSGNQDAGFRLAQSGASAQGEGGDTGQASVEGAQENQATDQDSPIKEDLEEIVVTGSHIRSTDGLVGAQLITIDAEEISKTGASSVQDVLRVLPQNFGGGTSEDTREANLNNQNEAQGTGINLRGLGTGATLTLLNGRRMAAGGNEGYFADVSAIPVTLVDRIEILPDGASALYGSDAVAGVVNIVLKKQYDGITTQARLGSVTSGPLNEELLSQSFGTSWSRGSALLAVEYRNRDALPASARREMNSDLRAYGGNDFRVTTCNPGTIVVGTQSYAIPIGQDGTSLATADFSADTENRCNRSTGTNIVSAERKWSLFSTLRQQITDTIELFADAGYTERYVRYPRGIGAITLSVPNTNAFYVNPTGGSDPVSVQYSLANDLPQESTGYDKALNIGVAAAIDLNSDWRILTQVGHSSQKYDGRVSVNVDTALLNFYLNESNPAVAFNPFGDGSHTSPSTLAALADSSMQFIDRDSQLPATGVILEGPIRELPGGSVRLALGADYRRQTVRTIVTHVLRSNPMPRIEHYVDFKREVTASFAELHMPLVDSGNRRRTLERLELSVAARHERYNDFGDTTVPRIGVRWSPIGDLLFRGNWSKSFKAPSAFDLSEAGNLSFITDLPAASGFGTVPVLAWSGGNAGLKEETSSNWTAGLEWRPKFADRLLFSATYFDIRFTDRIGRLPSVSLADPAVRAALTATPNEVQRAGACNPGGQGFLGNFSTSAPGDCLTAPVTYLFDLRTNNQALVNETGVDFLASYDVPTSTLGRFNLSINAAYISKYEITQTRTSPRFDLVDTANNPLAMKVRGSLGWSSAGLSLAAHANYAGSYDYSVVDQRKVPPWITFDLNATYDFGGARAVMLSNLQVSLNIQNLFDERPPFYNNPAGIAYDPANADLLNQYISITLRKGW